MRSTTESEPGDNLETPALEVWRQPELKRLNGFEPRHVKDEESGIKESEPQRGRHYWPPGLAMALLRLTTGTWFAVLAKPPLQLRRA
ncbi:hypothetical protein TrVFT333_001303 [Trichoderma virens FT-333]|nr:hypothetical protein TrVFT333_001303 [Trichoderma virens FT-333]